MDSELASACKAEMAEIGNVNDVDMLEVQNERETPEVIAELERQEELEAPTPPKPGPEIIIAMMCMIFSVTQAGLAMKIDTENQDEIETGMDSQEENTTDSDEDIPPRSLRISWMSRMIRRGVCGPRKVPGEFRGGV